MSKPHLRLVHGGLFDDYRLSGVHCRLTAGRASPPEPEAVVFEEDTHLILTVDNVIRYTEMHPIRLMNDILHSRVHAPGSLVAKGKSWYAVVIDVDRRPICRTEWIAEAYAHIGKKIQREAISVIAMHLLGTIHGRISVVESFALFAKAVRDWKPNPLREIRLILPEHSREAARQELRFHADP